MIDFKKTRIPLTKEEKATIPKKDWGIALMQKNLWQLEGIEGIHVVNLDKNKPEESVKNLHDTIKKSVND